MNSIVLWYDIGRQGATNESMVENPTLKDLSGNGHDATCYNFAWSGMSGIGGFPLSTKTKDGVVIIPTDTYAYSIATNSTDEDIDVSFDITGNEGKMLIVRNINKNDSSIDGEMRMTRDGRYTFTVKANCYMIAYTTYKPTEDNVYPGGQIVRFIPLYPGAIVTDGVDDKCETESIEPLSDFTIITERECISQSNGASFATAQKAFNFEKNNSGAAGSIIQRCVSYGNGSSVISAAVTGRSVSWMTPTSYKGIVALTRGTNEAAAGRLTIGYNYDYGNRYGAWALWSFLLFRRTLTEQEIEWVKNNLIEAKQ